MFDSFRFLKSIQVLNDVSVSGFEVSLDILSLVTDVPLGEPIDICADILYRGHLCNTRFPENS